MENMVAVPVPPAYFQKMRRLPQGKSFSALLALAQRLHMYLFRASTLTLLSLSRFNCPYRKNPNDVICSFEDARLATSKRSIDTSLRNHIHSAVSLHEVSVLSIPPQHLNRTGEKVVRLIPIGLNFTPSASKSSRRHGYTTSSPLSLSWSKEEEGGSSPVMVATSFPHIYRLECSTAASPYCSRQDTHLKRTSSGPATVQPPYTNE